MDELIYRQDVINEITEVRERILNMQIALDCEQCVFRVFKQFPHTDEEIQKMQDLEQAEIKKAYELGKQDAQQLIPCSVRPEKGKKVLLQYGLEAGDIRFDVAEWEHRHDEWVDAMGVVDQVEDRDVWYTRSYYFDYNKGIAWMPLPEP